MRLTALLASWALLWSRGAGHCADYASPPLPERFVRFVELEGRPYGLSFNARGETVLTRPDAATGRSRAEALRENPLNRLIQFVSCIPEGGAEAHMAKSLRSYLGSRPSPKGFEGRLFAGRDRLTPLGRGVLMDILTAEDGVLFQETPDFLERLDRVSRDARARPPSRPDGLDETSSRRFFDGSAVVSSGRDAVDGSHGWAGRALAAYVLREVRGSAEVPSPAPETADAAPAAGFIQRLSDIAVRAFQALPRDPFAPFLPWSGRGRGLAGSPGGPAASSAKRTLLRLDSLRREGLDGRGGILAVVDTGLDRSHPDFRGRVIGYVDLTGTGLEDRLGHGTHVAGIAAGSGEASEGRYVGAAPRALLQIYKTYDAGDVYGNGWAHRAKIDDRNIAALAMAAGLPEGRRPHVVNLSMTGELEAKDDHLVQMVNRLMIRDNILVVVPAGNGEYERSVEDPGVAEYVLTTSGVDSRGDFPEDLSRGPARLRGKVYLKPDLMTVVGDRQGSRYGVVGPDSRNGGYVRMRGSSQTAPFAAGAGLDVIGYLNEKGVPYRATEVKALMMETARDAGREPELQGAGILDGERLKAALESRVESCVSVGNIAYMLSVRLTSDQRRALDSSGRLRRTPLGLQDAVTGRLVRTDAELARLRSLAPAAR